MTELKLGLWGSNGHQIHRQLKAYPRLKLIAFGAFEEKLSEQIKQDYPEAIECASFEELLAVQGLEFISLCSPLRTQQAEQAIQALEKNIHVLAEKPCVIQEEDLDRVLAVAAKSEAVFHEMAGTVCDQVYWSMRQIVQSGIIGEVIQVFAQKSYPFYEGRPLSEEVDGGLTIQNGVHAMRFVEHITGLRAINISAQETALGEKRSDSDLKMASSMMGELENGGLYSCIANYLNPAGFAQWGNETVRIFASKGMIEAVDGTQRTRLVIGEKDLGSFELTDEVPDWLECIIDEVLDGKAMPFDLETELHPTRMLLRAKNNL